MKKQATKPPAHSQLLALPAELRMMLLEYAFPVDEHGWFNAELSVQNLAIVQAHPLFAADTAKIYASTALYFPTPLGQDLHPEAASQAEMVRSIYVTKPKNLVLQITDTFIDPNSLSWGSIRNVNAGRCGWSLQMEMHFTEYQDMWWTPLDTNRCTNFGTLLCLLKKRWNAVGDDEGSRDGWFTAIPFNGLQFFG